MNGAVTSIDSQKAACRAYIHIHQERGWQEYPEAFDDPAESGKNLDRPAAKRLLQAVREGRVQVVIVYKLDRLTRSSKDFHQLVELFEKRNVGLVSATVHCEEDTKEIGMPFSWEAFLLRPQERSNPYLLNGLFMSQSFFSTFWLTMAL